MLQRHFTRVHTELYFAPSPPPPTPLGFYTIAFVVNFPKRGFLTQQTRLEDNRPRA